MPHPWDYVAVLAAMLSTAGTLETSILQFTGTLFAMGRDNVLHPRYAWLHQTYRTPWFATSLITTVGLPLLYLPSYLSGIKTFTSDSANAIGFQIAFCYALAGLACAWYFRKQALTRLSRFIFLLAWPLLGVGFCLFIAVYNVPTYGLTTNTLGVGGVAIGIVPYLWSRSRINRRTATSAAA